MQLYTESQSAKSPRYIVCFLIRHDRAKWNKYQIGNIQVMTCKHIHQLAAKKNGQLNKTHGKEKEKGIARKLKQIQNLSNRVVQLNVIKKTHAEFVGQQQQPERAQFTAEAWFDLYTGMHACTLYNNTKYKHIWNGLDGLSLSFLNSIHFNANAFQFAICSRASMKPGVYLPWNLRCKPMDTWMWVSNRYEARLN